LTQLGIPTVKWTLPAVPLLGKQQGPQFTKSYELVKFITDNIISLINLDVSGINNW